MKILALNECMEKVFHFPPLVPIRSLCINENYHEIVGVENMR